MRRGLKADRAVPRLSRGIVAVVAMVAFGKQRHRTIFPPPRPEVKTLIKAVPLV